MADRNASVSGGHASFDEMRRVLLALPAADDGSAEAARRREAVLAKPAGALGRLEDLVGWFCAWQARHPPRLDHPRVAVFAGNHGVAGRGVSAFPASATAAMVKTFQAGGGAINQLCRTFDADLRVYEMALDRPTADIVDAPAMNAADCARAMAYGMTAVDDGIDVLCLGEMGIANTTAAAAIANALFGGAAADWTGPGSGLRGAALDAKSAVVAAAVARHAAGPAAADPFGILAGLGGHELAAIAGAVVAARMARVPVILDGYAATAAAAVLHRALPGALDHCLIGHISAEPAHRRLCAAIGKAPLLDLGMRLGEATGAALALGILKAAVDCHSGMATLAEAGIVRA